jgi:hypothetical protein
MFENEYSDDRNVTCGHCDFDGPLGLHLASFGDIEVGEWDCPECEGYNEYRRDFAWDRANDDL